MKNNVVLELFKNSRGAVIGDLYVNGTRILATSHPATLAAAVFVMAECEFEFHSIKGFGTFSFPVKTEELGFLAQLLSDQTEGNFISNFGTFSHFDFANPMFKEDKETDIHFRAAAHHLPSQLRVVIPTKPQPAGFKKELRKRNKFVYYPLC